MKNVNPDHKAPVVCLDAGHYGKYNQGIVRTYYESEAMWTLTDYLAAELEGYGIEVIKTRQVQALDMDLVTRGRKAANTDLFISMHSNACGTERVDRPEAIYLWDDNCGPIDEQSKEISGLLAETVRKIMGTKDPARTFTRKSANDRDGDGKVNDDYYGVLYGAHQVGVPGVILEHSFHTNRRACEWLLHDANLRTMAKAEAKVIAAWLGVEKPANTAGSSTPTTTTTTTAKEGFDVKMNTIKKGANGAQVAALQALLIGYGYDCGQHGADGDFGTATDAALRRYQAANNLTVDGIAGPKTWAKLLAQ